MTTQRYAVSARGSRQHDGPAADGEFTLLELLAPTDAEVDRADRELGLSAHAASVVHAPHLRARMDLHGDCLTVVMKAARLEEATSKVEVDELVVIVSPTAAAVIVRGVGAVLPDLRARLSHGVASPAAVLQAVLEVLVPDYDEVLVGLDEDVSDVEAKVFSPERVSHTQQIYALKRELLELRRAIVPLVDVVDRLVTEPTCPVPDELRPALRTIRARLRRTADSVEHLDGLIDTVLDAQLAQIGVRQNEDQRKISAWAAIALVPTVIGGIYGMNFDNMPELHWQYGYFLALSVIAAVCAVLFAGFRRNGWL